MTIHAVREHLPSPIRHNVPGERKENYRRRISKRNTAWHRLNAFGMDLPECEVCAETGAFQYLQSVVECNSFRS